MPGAAAIGQRALRSFRRWTASSLSVAVLSCGGGSLDGGYDTPRGALPIDERNPVLLTNDGGHDNWDGEVAVALSGAGRADRKSTRLKSSHQIISSRRFS